jgi:hypothetical protein
VRDEMYRISPNAIFEMGVRVSKCRPYNLSSSK